MGEPQRVLCGARSKRTGLPCGNPPLCGCKNCRMHGGKCEGKPNLAAMTTGERSKYVLKSKLPEIAAGAEAIRKDPSLVVALNMSERQERRAELPNPDMDTTLALHAADARDALVVMKATEMDRASAAPAAATTIVLSDPARVVQVRLRDGSWVRAMKGADEDSWLLEERSTGSWHPARPTQHEGDEVFERLLLPAAPTDVSDR
jgi:hypothetical protein